jgi:hypothetical protein
MARTRIIDAVAVLLVTAAILAAPAQPVRGKSLPATIENPMFQNFDGSGSRGAIGFEEQGLAERLMDGLTSAANGLFSGRPGWDCLSAAKVQRPWTVEIHSTIWLPPVPGSAWSVAVSVHVQPGDHWGSRLRRTVAPGASLVLVGTEQLREVIDELTSRVKPCWPKAKIKGRRSVTQEGATINYEWQGEETLRLGQDGGFEARLPVKMQVRSAIADCTIRADIDIGLAVTGSHRDNGRLVFTKMDSAQIQSSATVRCPDSPERSVPIRPWWGGSWMGEPEVGVPLEDGARASLRPPWLLAEPGAGEMTLELEYGRGGATPVAAAPRD